MSDFQAIADRVEIEALRGEFTDAAMMRDYDRAATLFTPDAVVRMPHVPVELGYQRTTDGWKFTERVYEIRYLDTTPLAGSGRQAGP
jgi:ketosteroid isomerase-like protein